MRGIPEISRRRVSAKRRKVESCCPRTARAARTAPIPSAALQKCSPRPRGPAPPQRLAVVAFLVAAPLHCSPGRSARSGVSRVAAPPRTHHCRTVPVRPCSPCTAARLQAPHCDGSDGPDGPGLDSSGRASSRGHPLLPFFLPSPGLPRPPPGPVHHGAGRGGAAGASIYKPGRARGQREAPRPRAEGTTQHAPRPAPPIEARVRDADVGPLRHCAEAVYPA